MTALRDIGVDPQEPWVAGDTRTLEMTATGQDLTTAEIRFEVYRSSKTGQFYGDPVISKSRADGGIIVTDAEHFVVRG